MPTLGKNKIDPAMDRTTTILAMELLAMKDLKIRIPKSVNTDAINDNFDKNCSSNFNSSISNQVRPGPGLGIARKTNMIIAVPTMINRKWGGSSLTSLAIKNTTMLIEPK